MTQDSHIELAQAYFDDLARRFPVMCASDEFHFLPRAQAAAKHYDSLDNLDANVIGESIEHLKSIQKTCARLEQPHLELETRIDLQMLQANIAGFLVEFDHKRSWQLNPLLYLKIAFIGLDHGLNKPAAGDKERADRVSARLSNMHRVLEQAVTNIRAVPQSYHQASRAMIADCRRYLQRLAKDLPARIQLKPATTLTSDLDKTAAALEALDRYLASLHPQPDHEFAAKSLPATLQNHFLCQNSVDEIFDMAVDEWHDILASLEAQKAAIDPSASWQELYHGYFPAGTSQSDTMKLYRDEIARLRLFFSNRIFRGEALDAPLEIAPTPDYLRSVRGTASFAAAFTADVAEKSYFYITTAEGGRKETKADNLLKKRFHREFKPLAAHEAIPGHHFLDAVRRRLSNPVRRQIESPLFYEGWASYAEYLLIESGYITSPMDLLVDYKRRLWRSARCQVDVGLTTGKINPGQAINLLVVCGFSPAEARRQVDRFRLNPGYQLCYSLGCHEFKQLRASYGNRMDMDQFHRVLLEGGQLPFHLIEQRLDALADAIEAG